jgi:SOS-response transcriptional repressor LexA
MKTIGEFFREKREAAGMSLREAAKASGISHGHIDDIEAGNKMPAFDKVMKLLRAYHADVQDFLKETGYLPVNVEPASMGKLRTVPVISWVTAGRWHEVSDPYEAGIAEDWVESDVKGSNVFALRVKGDSMEPEFVEGDIIVVNPHVSPKPGDFVIVKNEDNDEAIFKQLKKYGDTYILHPLNPKYPDIELTARHKYRIVGKVVEKKKRY